MRERSPKGLEGSFGVHALLTVQSSTLPLDVAAVVSHFDFGLPEYAPEGSHLRGDILEYL